MRRATNLAVVNSTPSEPQPAADAAETATRDQRKRGGGGFNEARPESFRKLTLAEIHKLTEDLCRGSNDPADCLLILADELEHLDRHDLFCLAITMRNAAFAYTVEHDDAVRAYSKKIRAERERK